MAGLVPAIYVFTAATSQGVDARDKPGHDEKLELPVPLRIDQPVDPLRGRHCEPHRHRFACGGWQAMLGRLAMEMGAVGVGDDQTGAFREYLARQILREGEEQLVAMHPV